MQKIYIYIFVEFLSFDNEYQTQEIAIRGPRRRLFTPCHYSFLRLVEKFNEAPSVSARPPLHTAQNVHCIGRFNARENGTMKP